MKLTKRLLSLLLAFAMLCAVVPMGLTVSAEEIPAETEVTEAATLPDEAGTDDAQTDAVGTQIPVIGETLELDPWVNPLYADVLDVTDLPEPQPMEKPDASVQSSFLLRDKAAEKVRDYMKARTETFTFYVYDGTSDYNALLTDILNTATLHSGVATEGDYLLWHVMGVAGGEVEQNPSGYGYNYTYTITLVYSTTLEQENTVNTAVATLLNQWNVWNKTDYEKVRVVYDYICENVTYDYDHLEDETYYLQFSAYAALINKTAVCQGYSLLFYRLMLELGVDCRVITGIAGDDASGYGGHAWNIVALDGLYFNVDATWDTGYDEYWWFLNNTWNFVGHYRYAEYETMEFHTAYPMAAEDYDPNVPGEMDPYICGGYCGDNAYWVMGRNGHLEIFGEGPMYDYASSGDNIPDWIYLWSEYIAAVTVAEGITRIGNFSFCSLQNLAEVVLPDSLSEIGSYSFEYCKQMILAELPKNLTRIGDCAFAQCNGLTEVTIPAGVESLGFNAFQNCGGLKKVTLENSGSVGPYAFSSCYALEELTISGDITRISSAAFQNCKALKEVTFPESIKQLDPSSFAGCTALSVITFLGDAPSIQPYTFEGVTATAYYPANSTWTEDVRQDYMGNITWVSTCSHEYESEVTEPTCASQGFTTHTCSLCGSSYVDSYIDALPHTPGEAQTENIVNATCSAKGSYESVTYCIGCGLELERVTEETELLPHAYESLVTAPSCEERGCTTHTCVECGDSYVDSYVDALGHTYEDGYCAVCGQPERALGDVDGNGEIDILDANLTVAYYNEITELTEEQLLAADVNGNGVVDIMDANMIVAYYNEVIDSFPIEAVHTHSYETTTVAPTTDSQGYDLHTCSICGDSYRDNYTEKLSLTEELVYERMIAMKDQYPEGLYWTNDNYYQWNGGIYNIGYGCAGFAFLLSDAAFGDLYARMITEDISIDMLRVGDILRINNDTHTVIVLEVHEGYVVIAEGNYNNSIHWGRTLSASDVAEADYVLTRYPE